MEAREWKFKLRRNSVGVLRLEGDDGPLSTGTGVRGFCWLGWRCRGGGGRRRRKREEMRREEGIGSREEEEEGGRREEEDMAPFPGYERVWISIFVTPEKRKWAAGQCVVCDV